MLLLFSVMTITHANPIEDLANTALLSSQPDAYCLDYAKPPGSSHIDIPINAQGTWVDIDMHLQGPASQGPKAIEGGLRFSDGSFLEVHAWLGKQVAPYAITGQDSQSIILGSNPKGNVLGQRWRIATGQAQTTIASIELKSRLRNHRLCITQIRVHNQTPHPDQTDTENWYTFVPNATLKTPPQSLPVNGPAVQAIHRGEDGHFYNASAQRVRFWGVNLTGPSAIPPKSEADARAKLLAQLGFNAVRLHHIDAPNSGLLNPKRHQPDQPVFHPERLDALDYFVSRLKAHGIYLFLEVATLRELGPKEGLPALGPLPAGHKVVTMFRPRWTQAYLQAFEDLWGRTNPYTENTYANEPAVAVIELSNEHSLLSQWGSGIEKLHKNHLLILNQLWNRFLKNSYKTDQALAQAWKGSPSHGGLLQGESLEKGSVRRAPEHPGLRYAYPHQRLRDLNRFYASLETKFYESVAKKAKEMGFTQPVVASMSFGRPQLQQIYGQWDAADLHIEWGQTNARRTLANDSAIRRPRTQRLLESAIFAVDQQAFLVTELNHPFPNKTMAEAPILWAALASRQDWDALIWFEWLFESPNPDRNGFVHSQFDLSHATVKTAQMPSASSLFRSGWVPPADGYFPVHRSPSTATLQSIYGKTPLPWQTQDVDFWIRHRIRTVLDEEPHPGVATTGSSGGIRWSPKDGYFVLDNPYLQAIISPGQQDATGEIPQSTHLEIRLDNWAAVSLATTDGTPLKDAQSALLTIATTQENTGMAWELEHSVVRAWGGAPILIQPAEGSIILSWKGRPKVEVLNESGETIERLRVRRKGRHRWEIPIDQSLQSPWIFIQSR